MSASASFAASGILAITGVGAIKAVKNRNQIALAILPWLFSAQQFSEGFVWLSMQNEAFEFLHFPAVYSFLFIAEVLWPIMVPLSILLLEKDLKRKLIMRIGLFIAICFSLYLLYNMIFYTFDAVIRKYHIQYVQLYPDSLFDRVGSIIYVLTTVAIPFVSSYKPVRWLGLAILTSFLISHFFYNDSLISVWCFFAAIASVLVYFTIKRLNINNSRITG